jgi:hypothetical protein
MLTSKRTVVALAGAAVNDGGGTGFEGFIHQQLCHERPGQGCRQRILAFVHGITLQRREDEIVDKEFFRIDNDRFNRPNLECLFPDGGKVFLVTNIYIYGNNLEAVFFLKPFDEDRGIEPSLYASTTFYAIILLLFSCCMFIIDVVYFSISGSVSVLVGGYEDAKNKSKIFKSLLISLTINREFPIAIRNLRTATFKGSK